MSRYAPTFRVPGVSGYGRWLPFTWDNKGSEQHGVDLVPERAPWRDLFNALDAAGQSVSDEPVEIADEAKAVVACCLRYGTYFHVLTSGVYYPEFTKNARLSRIGDDEMKRINIEFSSSLAEWWKARTDEPRKIRRRTRAAMQLIPMPWQADTIGIEVRADTIVDHMETMRREGIQRLTSALPTSIRHEANYAVAQAYRNGPIEDLHAGTWSLGREVPGYVRLYAGDVRRICSAATKALGGIMIAREHPKVATTMAQVSALAGPQNWSLTDETSAVRFHGMPGAGPLDDRLRMLAEHNPVAYAGVERGGG